MSEKELTPRKNVLTPADLEELSKLLADHPCKFKVSHEEMDSIKRMSGFFNTVEKKVIDAITWAVIAVLGGFFWLLYNHGYISK